MPRAWLNRGALRKGAPFLWLLLCAATTVIAADCPADRVDDRGHVAYVYDGDTVRLDDGRKIRFIGINAPEVAHRNKPAEPYANEARQLVEHLIAEQDGRLLLRFGSERHDHYGRTLAHLYLPNGESLEAALLRRGLATTLTIPPNLWNEGCYRALENDARKAGVGVWSLPSYRPIASRDLDPQRDEGYRFVSGRVERIGRSRKSLWLNLEGAVAVRIPREDLDYFDHPESLEGTRVLARGWLHRYKGRLSMTVRHPADLSILDSPLTPH